MRRLALAVLFTAACGSSPATTVPELPWLHGFTATAASDTLIPDPSGGAVIRITGELAPAQGEATIAVSYAEGVVVRDRGGAVVARAPGFGETGSSDDVVAVGLGDGLIGSPLIAVAVNRGGHQISTTSLALYRLEHGKLERLFFAPIEERDGDQTVAGSVTVLPGSLLYRAPGEPTARVWMFDAARDRYVPPGA